MPQNVLRVDRNKWNRGNGNGTLNNSRGLMCILGFVANHVGVTKAAMRGVSRLTGLDEQNQLKVSEAFPWLETETTNLMIFNDCTGISDFKRCARIRKIFKSHDWEVKFVQ